MRVLGFAKKWTKLQKPVHTTFRFPRKDADRGRDWHKGEVVQEVYHSRSAVDREIMGVAEIISIDTMQVMGITDAEAREDGFPCGYVEMCDWLAKAHKTNATILAEKTINKLTLRRVPELPANAEGK